MLLIPRQAECVQCPATPPSCQICPIGEVCVITSQNCTQCAQSLCLNEDSLGTGPPPSKKGSSMGAMAGGIVAGVVLLAALAVGGFFFLRKRRAAAHHASLAKEGTEKEFGEVYSSLAGSHTTNPTVLSDANIIADNRLHFLLIIR